MNLYIADIKDKFRRCVTVTCFMVLLALIHLPFLTCFAAPVPIIGSKNTIKVVMDDNYPPYVFKDDQGNLKGILIDQWRLWENKTGIRVEITGMDWSEAQRRMQGGEFDVIDTIFKTEKRMVFFDFSKPYAKLNFSIFLHNDISGIRDAKDLKGFLVGVKSGGAVIDILKQFGVENIATFPSDLSIVEAARDSKIKVFVIGHYSALYFLNKLQIANDYRQSANLFSAEFHRAVLKGNVDLLAKIENGFAAISAAEYQAIDKQWLGTPVGGLIPYKHLWYAAGVTCAVVGLILGWLVLLRRAVHRKTRQLSESEERYRSIIDNMQDVYYRSDAEGRLTMLSPSGVELLGYASMEEMLGLPIRETFYYDPDERDAFVHNLKMKGALNGYEVTLKRKDGKPVPVATSTHLMFDPEGVFIGIEGVFRDITSQRSAEDALRSSEERYRHLVEQSTAWIWKTDASFRHIYTNENVQRILGYPPEEFCSKDIITLVHPDDHELFRKTTEDAVSNNRGWSGLVFRWLTRSGSWRSIESSGVPVFDEEGVFVGLQGVDTDITDRLQLEEEREKGQRLESLGLLASGIAHDFNNILTGIVGNLSLARMMISNDHRAAERLEECEKAAKRASELTQQLLTFARGGEPVKKTVDASRLLNEAVSFGLRGSSVKGVLELADDLWPIYVDEGQINQVLNNLLINATQAMPKGGTVTVRAENLVPEDAAETTERFVQLTIRDTGVGIPPDILTKIFDPYFTTKTGGTGLGLASVYSIVTRHGGSVKVSSESGHGTEFVICLPAAEMVAQQELDDVAGHSGSCIVERILVMDDEQMIIEVATIMLSELGCAVDTCRDGAEAVALYQAALEMGTPYDAVILDMTVPGGMGGLEAGRLIRAMDPKAVLIVSSGYSHDAVMADLNELGFSGAVMKPYTMDTMVEELNRVKGRSGHRGV